MVFRRAKILPFAGRQAARGKRAIVSARNPLRLDRLDEPQRDVAVLAVVLALPGWESMHDHDAERGRRAFQAEAIDPPGGTGRLKRSMLYRINVTGATSSASATHARPAVTAYAPGRAANARQARSPNDRPAPRAVRRRHAFCAGLVLWQGQDGRGIEHDRAVTQSEPAHAAR
jgi:hypothetical protein